MFTKTLTASALSLTLVFTSLAPAPAAADISERDAIAGIAALLLFGAVINNTRDDNDHVQQPRSQRDWRVVPASCLRTIPLRRSRTIELFGQRCMNQTYAHESRLPQTCRVRVTQNTGELRRGYRPDCLRDHGFRTSRH